MAIICGIPSSQGLYFCAIDFDVKNLPKDVVEKGWQVLKVLRITRIEQTPSSGQHWLYLSYTKPRSISAYHNQAALELIGEGKLCIVAPSKGYKRLNDNSLTVVPDADACSLKHLKQSELKLKTSTTLKLRPKYGLTERIWRASRIEDLLRFASKSSEGTWNITEPKTSYTS